MTGHILVVENDPEIVGIVRDLLERDGHTVITATDSEEGLRLFKFDPFDVIITDVGTPKTDGIEMMRAIKRSDSAVEVIVLADAGTMEMAVEMIRRGGYDFLRKPDDIQHRLGTAVQRALEKRHLGIKYRNMEQTLETQVREKMEDARRLTAQHVVTDILAESDTLEDVAPRVMDQLLDSLGWAFGAMWIVDKHDDVLRCVDIRHVPDLRLETCADQRQKMDWTEGTGLPGRTWAHKQPEISRNDEHIETITGSGATIRLHGVGFPLILGDEVLGVIEGFHIRRPEPDDNLIRMMSVIGKQVGLSIQREQLERQFRQSQKMEAIGRLASGIAHDFNNLLTSIIGYAHLIERKLNPEDKLNRNAVQIQKTGQRAAAMIQQLLTFSRNQSQKTELMDLNQVIDQMKPMLQRLLTDNTMFNTDLASSIDLVLVDQTQLEQVILNLAVNARDAMPDGGVLSLETSTVRLQDSEAHLYGLPAGAYIRLDVHDTGHGMDESVQAHLFEPFFTTKESGKGSGLGLATVNGIVTQSGGAIKVVSTPGEGTTFSIYFPVARITAPSATQVVMTPVANDLGVFRGTETLLFVEEDEDLRDTSRQILEQAGYTVLEAHDGFHALTQIEQHPASVHLVITNITMPLMNGGVFVEHLLKSYPKTRVIFMSGLTDEATLPDNLRKGMPLLRKPFIPEDLLRQVRESLDASQRRTNLNTEASSKYKNQIAPLSMADRGHTPEATR